MELKQTRLVNSVAFSSFSSDGKQIVFGSGGCVRVCDVLTGELMELMGNTGVVQSVSFVRESKQIVSGSSDNTVCVYDASTGVKLKELNLKGHTGIVSSVSFASDGMQIVSGSSDNSMHVWDVSTGVKLKELKGHTDSITSVAFLSNGT